MAGSRRAVVLNSQNVPLFIRHVRERGGDARGIIERFQLDPAIEQATDARMKLRDLHAFGDACAEAVQDVNFGLAAAESAPRGSYGLVEFACRSAATFGEGLEQLVRHYALLDDPARVRLEAQNGLHCLSFELPGDPLCWGRHSNECGLALFCRIAREASGGVLLPERVWFAHPRPLASEQVFAGLACRDISFGSGVNGLAFSSKLLNVPLLSADRALLRALENKAAAELEPSASGSDFLHTLRARVRRALGGEVRIEVIAAQLKMSSRTVQRRLADEGTSFQSLIDAVRQAEAQALLESSDRSIKEIARALGYSETSAFVRAYKRATGTTPGQARRGKQPAGETELVAR